MYLKTFPTGPLQCNCSIIACKETKDAMVIDPGGDSEVIQQFLEKEGFTLKYIMHTHAHFDHVLGAKELRVKSKACICLNKGDEWLYNNLELQCSLFGFKPNKADPIDKFLMDEEEIIIGNLKVKTIHTPGHTPGSMCFSMVGQDNLLFSGDTLFNRGIGRTDLWGGSHEQILKSISNRLWVLEDETKVIPGHGPNTNIWSEKRDNPFLN